MYEKGIEELKSNAVSADPENKDNKENKESDLAEKLFKDISTGLITSFDKFSLVFENIIKMLYNKSLKNSDRKDNSNNFESFYSKMDVKLILNTKYNIVRFY